MHFQFDDNFNKIGVEREHILILITFDKQKMTIKFHQKRKREQIHLIIELLL